MVLINVDCNGTVKYIGIYNIEMKISVYYYVSYWMSFLPKFESLVEIQEAKIYKRSNLVNKYLTTMPTYTEECSKNLFLKITLYYMYILLLLKITLN